MKIICVDGYGKENVADILICENVNEYIGQRIVDFLNYSGDESRWYKLVDDDHKLWRGMEELV